MDLINNYHDNLLLLHSIITKTNEKNNHPAL